MCVLILILIIYLRIDLVQPVDVHYVQKTKKHMCVLYVKRIIVALGSLSDFVVPCADMRILFPCLLPECHATLGDQRYVANTLGRPSRDVEKSFGSVLLSSLGAYQSATWVVGVLFRLRDVMNISWSCLTYSQIKSEVK